MRMITLLLVDDEPRVRRGLRMWFALEPDIRVVGEAADAAEAVALAQALRPDVVLMDVAMPGMDGVQATAALRAAEAPCAVVMLSMRDDPATRVRAEAVGSFAFVGKHQAADTLLPVIRAAAGREKSGE
jgi:DNA-binding NarL/FixJ family response regulator